MLIRMWISGNSQLLLVGMQNDIATLKSILRVITLNINLNVCACCVLSHIWLFVTPWSVAYQAPLSMEFSRQEYSSGLPFLTRGILPNPGIEPVSPLPPALAGRFFTTVESSLDWKKVKPVSSKGNQSWIFIGRLMLKLQYLATWWERRANSLEKTLMLGKIEGIRGGNRGWDGWMASPTQWTWVQQTPGDGEGQGILACCSPWGHKDSHTTEQLKKCHLGTHIYLNIHFINLNMFLLYGIGAVLLGVFTNLKMYF